jgi:hypothetical protein
MSVEKQTTELRGVRPEITRSDWEIRPARQRDVDGILTCFETNYDGYAGRVVDRSALSELIAGDSMHIYVAEYTGSGGPGHSQAGRNTVAGTISVKYHPQGDLAEVGKMAVRPEYQGITMETDEGEQRLGADLAEIPPRDVFQNNVRRVFGQPVTTHAKTQRILRRSGLAPVAYARQVTPYMFEGGREGLLKLLIQMWSVDTSPDVVYVPDQELREMVTGILEGMQSSGSDVERDVRTIECKPTPGSGSVGVSEQTVIGEDGIYTIDPEGDRDIEAVYEQILQETIGVGTDYAEVRIPTDVPTLCPLVAALREAGFVPTGYLPEWFVTDDDQYRDLLTLSYTPGQPQEIELLEPVLDMFETLPWTDDVAERATPHESVDGVFELEL